MITTICLNPAMDRTITVDSLVPGQVNRILSSRIDVGGKGVNVAVVCSRLGMDAQIIGCAGAGGFAKLQEKAAAEKIGCIFHTVEGSIRVNTKVVPQDGSGVTELNEQGPVLTAEDLDVFFDLVLENAKASEYVVITGSLPPGCPGHTYRRLIEMLSPVPCILDVSGAALLEGVKAKPFLIKPNHHELELSVGHKLHTLEEIRKAAQGFVESGVQHVIVSLGSQGALYVSQDISCYAPAVPVEVHSTVGAGDALVGGVLYGLMHDHSMRIGFRAGVAAGTASVMTEGTQLIDPEEFTRLLSQVQLREI